MWKYDTYDHKRGWGEMKRKICHLMTIVGVWALLSSTSAYCQTFEEYKEVGDNYLRSGKSDLAIGEYKKALELNPGSTAVTFNLAIAYYKERNLKATISVLERIVQLDPNDTEAYYNLGCLKLYGRNFEAACDYFKKAHAEQTLEFVGKLKNLDLQTQSAVLLSLAAQSLLQ